MHYNHKYFKIHSFIYFFLPSSAKCVPAKKCQLLCIALLHSLQIYAPTIFFQPSLLFFDKITYSQFLLKY